MGVYIDGWIEVTSDSREWYGAVRTRRALLYAGKSEPILYELYELGTNVLPPSDFSSEVLDTFDDTYGLKLYVVKWQQIVMANWNEASPAYLLLLELMRVLVDFHGEDNVRLVCWSS